MQRLPEIEALELQRKRLAAQCDIYRQTLTVEYYHIRASTAWMRQAYAAGRAALPWLTLLAPLGALLARKRRAATGGLASKLVLGLNLARILLPLWKLRSTFAQRKANVNGKHDVPA